MSLKVGIVEEDGPQGVKLHCGQLQQETDQITVPKRYAVDAGQNRTPAPGISLAQVDSVLRVDYLRKSEPRDLQANCENFQNQIEPVGGGLQEERSQHS